MPIKFRREAPIIILILISIVSSFWFYQRMPEVVPVHWGINGQADGFGPKWFAAFFFPVLIIGLYLLFTFLPHLDPKKERYREFAESYQKFKFGFTAFFVFIYFVASLAGIGYNVPVGKVVAMGTGILIILIGNYLGKIKPNWFVGIKTPWTLSNEEVWSRTHRFGGKLFVLSGSLTLFGTFLRPEVMFGLVIGPILLSSLISVIYSYIIYKKLPKNPEQS